MNLIEFAKNKQGYTLARIRDEYVVYLGKEQGMKFYRDNTLESIDKQLSAKYSVTGCKCGVGNRVLRGEK